MQDKSGKVHPIEIKKSSNPNKTAIRHFSVIHEDKIQEGAVICLSKTDYPITQTVSAIPVGYI